MLYRIFLMLVVIYSSINLVYAKSQELYNFLIPNNEANTTSHGAIVDSTLMNNQQNEQLRRITFTNDTKEPELVIAGSLWDLSNKKAISFRIQNAMDWDLTLYVTIKDTNQQKLQAVIALPAGYAQHLLIPLTAMSSRKLGMREGLTSQWQKDNENYLLPINVTGSVDRSKINSITMSINNPNVPQNILMGSIKATDTDAEQMAYYHIVDKYGQNSHKVWPQKISSDKQLKQMAQAESLQLKKWLKEKAPHDKYGGIGNAPQFTSSHFFRLEKNNNRWYFVSPNGYPFVSLGINTVCPNDSQTYIDGREFMFASLPNAKSELATFYGYANTSSGNAAQGGRGVDKGKWFDFYQANLYRIYGKTYLTKWYDNTVNRLKAWGFNTIGNWSDDALIKQHKLPYTTSILIKGDYAGVSSGMDWWGAMPDTFDPRFTVAVDKAVKLATANRKSDPWLIGYFADNELSWGGIGNTPSDHYALVINTLAKQDNSPAKQAFISKLEEKYGDIANLNTAWGVNITSWAQLQKEPFKAPLPDSKYPAIEEDYSHFLTDYADNYFRTVKEALVKYDPNHLFLGNRFAVKLPEVITSCAKYCDVISFNSYTLLASQGYDKQLIEALDKPIMITEFTFGSKVTGAFWGGPIVVNSEMERGKSYQQFVNNAFEDPHMVGVHWFQYIDEPLTGRLLDGENGHIGLVSITDRPVHDLIKKVRETNVSILSLLKK